MVAAPWQRPPSSRFLLAVCARSTDLWRSAIDAHDPNFKARLRWSPARAAASAGPSRWSLRRLGCDLLLTARDMAALDRVAAEVRAQAAARDPCRRSEGRGRAATACRPRKAAFRPPRHPGQQCRRLAARRFLRADRRRLERGLRSEILRPGPALPRGVAAAQRQRRFDRRHRRHRRPCAGRRLHDRLLGDRRAACVHEGAGRPRQARWRAGQQRQSGLGRHRPLPQRLDIVMKRTGLDEAAAIEHHRKELDITRFGQPEDVAGWSLHRLARAGAGCTAPRSTWTAARSSRCGCRDTTEKWARRPQPKKLKSRRNERRQSPSRCRR